VPAGQGRLAHLVRFKGLLVGEEQLIPHHLHALLCVHGKEGALDARHVPLVHLRGTGRHERAHGKAALSPAPRAAPRGGSCCVDTGSATAPAEDCSGLPSS